MIATTAILFLCLQCHFVGKVYCQQEKTDISEMGLAHYRSQAKNSFISHPRAILLQQAGVRKKQANQHQKKMECKKQGCLECVKSSGQH